MQTILRFIELKICHLDKKKFAKKMMAKINLAKATDKNRRFHWMVESNACCNIWKCSYSLNISTKSFSQEYVLLKLRGG